MTTNMYKVFNSILKEAQSLPITTLVQLTFFRLNNYFVARREQGYNRLTSDEQYTPYVDAKIKAHVTTRTVVPDPTRRLNPNPGTRSPF